MASTDILTKYDKLYSLMGARNRARVRDIFPDTGGNENLLHNWYHCKGNAHATAILRSNYKRLHYVVVRGNREWTRSQSA